MKTAKKFSGAVFPGPLPGALLLILPLFLFFFFSSSFLCGTASADLVYTTDNGSLGCISFALDETGRSDMKSMKVHPSLIPEGVSAAFPFMTQEGRPLLLVRTGGTPVTSRVAVYDLQNMAKPLGSCELDVNVWGAAPADNGNLLVWGLGMDARVIELNPASCSVVAVHKFFEDTTYNLTQLLIHRKRDSGDETDSAKTIKIYGYFADYPLPLFGHADYYRKDGGQNEEKKPTPARLVELTGDIGKKNVTASFSFNSEDSRYGVDMADLDDESVAFSPRVPVWGTSLTPGNNIYCVVDGRQPELIVRGEQGRGTLGNLCADESGGFYFTGYRTKQLNFNVSITDDRLFRWDGTDVEMARTNHFDALAWDEQGGMLFAASEEGVWVLMPDNDGSLNLENKFSREALGGRPVSVAVIDIPEPEPEPEEGESESEN